MKTIKKKIDLTLTSSEFDIYPDLGCSKYGYYFKSKQFISNIDSLEFHVQVNMPETLKEFKKVHDLSSVELVDWLNKNYEK